VIDAVSSFAVSLATGNPLLAALAPLGRKRIARAFGKFGQRGTRVFIHP
jgi:hypothetical protein